MPHLRIGQNAYLRDRLVNLLKDSFNTRIEPGDDLRTIDQKLGRREVIEFLEQYDEEDEDDGNL